MAGGMISLTGVERTPEGPDAERLRLTTDCGAIECRYHPAVDGDVAILWVFGAGGGLGGPAGGIYTRLGARLRPRAVTSLELAYRQPGALAECVLDTLAGLAWLEAQGRSRVVLVGHSFGGAVVINAGADSDTVIAVVAMSSQTAGTSAVARLSPKRVLFIHGKADEVLSESCSYDLYARAGDPKQLIIYPRCRHGLDECRDALDRDLTQWLGTVIGLDHAS